MTDNKWTSFKVVGDIDRDIRSLYEAWATPAGLEKWFLRKANFYTVPRRTRDHLEFIRKEDTYDWYWHGHDDSLIEKGMVLEANETDVVRFTFTGGSVVTVSLYSRNGISIVELVQSNIPPEDDPRKNLYVQCKAGWTFYLANLKSIMEGGIDLRNKRLEINSNFK